MLEYSSYLNKLHKLLFHRDREWKIDYCMLNHPGYPGSGEGYVSDPEESDVIANWTLTICAQDDQNFKLYFDCNLVLLVISYLK